MIAVRIAWRNLWRNRRRSLLTLAALAFSTATLLFMFAWQNGSYDSMIRAAVSGTTGELQVLPAGYHENREIRNVIAEPDPILERLSEMERVRVAAPRAEAFALADAEERSRGVLVVGVDVEREPMVGNLRSIIRQGGYFSGNQPEIILGSQLADNLKAVVGSEVVLLGQGRDGSVAANVFTVCGIAASGQPELDRSLARIPLEDFRETFFMRGAVHRIVVNCTDLDELGRVEKELESFVATLEDDLVVKNWSELLPGLKQTIELDLVSGYIFYFLLLVVVAFSIMNTFIMAVMERSREFGILNAIGTNRYRLVRILLMESLFLALCGIAAGLVLGTGYTWYMQILGFVIPGADELLAQFGMPERIHPQLSWLVVGLPPLLVLAVTLLACVYPVIRLLLLHPVKAMHAQ